MFCSKCGAQNTDGAKFCRQCGNPLSNGIQKEYGKNEKKNNKTIFIIIGAIVIIAALVTAILFGMRGKKAKEYETYLASADKYIEELNYEQAKDYYLMAIDVAPKKLEPYVKLAKVYVDLEEIDEAEEILAKAEENNAEGSVEIEKEAEQVKKLVEEIKNKVSYEWVVDPIIEADDIYYVKHESPNIEDPTNIAKRQILESYAVIRIGNALGLIDMDGNMILKTEYKDIQQFYGQYLMKRIEAIYDDELNSEWDMYSWDSKKGLQMVDGLGGPGYGTLYYYDDLYNAHSIYEELELFDMNIPDNAIPVLIADEFYNGFDETGLGPDDWLDSQDKKYGVYYQGEIVTSDTYDECGSESEGLLAVCKDGKWGYVNQNGEVVIPIKYDASWDRYCIGGGIGESIYKEFCYAASDGHVVLRKDDKWELRDVTGKIVIPSGKFEAIRPVYQGKCWVKKDGKWGVIKLIKENEKIEDSQEEAFSFGDMPREFVFTSGVGAWVTGIEINEDGTFVGDYHDSEMGVTGEGYSRGMVYKSDFSGKFTQPEKITDYIYRMEIEYIETEQSAGESYIEDGIKYVVTEPYGMEDEGEFYIYLPGTPVSEMEEEYLSWTKLLIEGMDQEMPKGHYGLFNTCGSAFIGTIDDYQAEETVNTTKIWETELAQTEEKSEELKEKFNHAASQSEMNQYSSELYQLWDDEINQLWAHLKSNLGQSEMEALTKKQREWIKEKEAAMEAVSKEWEGGSGQTMAVCDVGWTMTEERVYELIEYLR